MGAIGRMNLGRWLAQFEAIWVPCLGVMRIATELSLVPSRKSFYSGLVTHPVYQ